MGRATPTTSPRPARLRTSQPGVRPVTPAAYGLLGLGTTLGLCFLWRTQVEHPPVLSLEEAPVTAAPSGSAADSPVPPIAVRLRPVSPREQFDLLPRASRPPESAQQASSGPERHRR